MKREERSEAETTEEIVDCGRRGAMKKIAVGVGVLAGCSVLPEKWTRPIIGQIVLPAHAATSGSTLHDPCAVELRGGDNTTASVIVKVTGFVTPPVANVPVTVTATAVGGAGLKVESKTTTSAAGTFEVFMTIGGGPGITSVNVTTAATGADGVANCVVHTTATSSTTNTNGQSNYRGTFRPGGESEDFTLCITIIGTNVTFLVGKLSLHPEEAISGGGPVGGPIVGSNATTDTTVALSILSRDSNQISVSLDAYQTSNPSVIFDSFSGITANSVSDSCV